MQCEKTKEFFFEYLDGSLDQAMMITISEHIKGCAACGRDYEQFRTMYRLLDAMPEIAPPFDFRHSIVMRAARLQHERTHPKKENTWSLFSIFDQLKCSRTVSFAGAALVLVVMLLFGGEKMHNALNQNLATGIQPPSVSSSDTQGIDVGDSSQKEAWLNRKLGRNTMWVSVNPKLNSDGRMLYDITLMVNERAYLTGELYHRIASSVYLLPDGQYGLDSDGPDLPVVWQGTITSQMPIQVPVIIDRSQSGERCVNLLVTWRYRDRTFSQIIFIPPAYRGLLPKDMSDPTIDIRSHTQSHSGLYSSLQSISESYGLVVIANADTLGKKPAIVGEQGAQNWKLKAALNDAGMEWITTDHAIYVDQKIAH